MALRNIDVRAPTKCLSDGLLQCSQQQIGLQRQTITYLWAVDALNSGVGSDTTPTSMCQVYGSKLEDFHNLPPKRDCIELKENMMKTCNNTRRPCLLYDKQHYYAGLLHIIRITTTFDWLENYWFLGNLRSQHNNTNTSIMAWYWLIKGANLGPSCLNTPIAIYCAPFSAVEEYNLTAINDFPANTHKMRTEFLT